MPKWAVVLIIVLAVGIVGLFGLSILAGFLVPTLLSGREEAYKVQCAHNLREIAKGGMIYATSGKRFFPHSPDGSLASLELVARQPGVPPEIFICPASPESRSPSSVGETLTEETCSYEMVPWRLAPTDSGAMLAYDERPHHGEGTRAGRNVVYTDSSVQFLLEDEFQTMFEEQRQRYGSR